MLVAVLSTAPTPCSSSASALTRSRSTWSMTAMSPGRSRPARFLVWRSQRTGAVSLPSARSPPRRRRVRRAPSAAGTFIAWILPEQGCFGPAKRYSACLCEYRGKRRSRAASPVADRSEPVLPRRRGASPAPPSALPVGRRDGQEFLGMGAAEFGVLEAGEHAGEFAGAAVAVEAGDAAF